MTESRRTIKVSTETFERMQELKDDRQTWDHFLQSISRDHELVQEARVRGVRRVLERLND